MLTSEQALSQLNALYLRLANRRPLIEKRFEYLDGKQGLVFASTEWRKFHADRFAGFADNWCQIVAQAPVDRLRVDGIRIGDSDGVTTEQEKQVWNDWQANEMTAQSHSGFLTTVAASRSAVIVWADGSGNPVCSWERPDQVAVAYDDLGRSRIAAIKSWTEGIYEYATLWTPEAVWKYQRAAALSEQTRQNLADRGFIVPGTIGWPGGWEPREVPGEAWPLNNPLGVVPVVEWQNQPRVGAEPISDIDGVIAMQNAINVAWTYLFAAADYASMPARVVLGSEPPKIPILDESGQVIGSKPAKLEDLAQGRILFLPTATGVATWDQAKADFFTSIIAEAKAHIAAQTRTPAHYLLTNDKMANLNGDALTATEVPLVMKCESFQLHGSPVVKEICALMAQVRGNDSVAAAIRGTNSQRFTHWHDASMNSLAAIADASTKARSIGMSLETVLERFYGFTEQEIARELDRIQAEQTEGIDAALTKTFASLANTAPDAALANQPAASQ